MRIGISGASGFLGQNIVKNLQKGLSDHEVITVGRSAGNSKYKNIFWDFDLGTNNSLLGNYFDYFFHLGWSGIPNYNSAVQWQQLESHKELVNQLLDNGTKRLFISGTCFEYGNRRGAVKESDECCPESLYAESKLELLDHVSKVFAKSDKTFIWGRIFYIYGEGQPSHTLLGSLINASNNAKTFHINNPRKIVDYSNIEDLSKLILKLTLQTDHHGIVNLGSGTPTTTANQARKWIEDLNLNIDLTESLGNVESEGFWSDRTILDSVLSPIEDS
jgi:dTDP-6-deoxy-L-talose 4-dehydrogenase (NAD+)